jgi:hypothetical protein
MAEQKLIGILIAIGLCIVAGIFAFIDQDKAKPDQPESPTVAVEPAAPKDATTGAVESAKSDADEQLTETPWSGKILVSRRPVQVLAAPSSSASAMYGFPAGRPFRALGSEGGFIRIQDVQSGAKGWIEEAALAPAPEAPPPAASTASGGGRSVTSARPGSNATAQTVAPTDSQPEVAAQPKRRGGIFGGGGLFGGLFGGR